MAETNEPEPPAQILARIPPPWFRSIDCGPGWYPMLEELDRQLAEIDPDYVVHQCKQKLGGLRYYTETKVEHQELRRFRDLIAFAEIRSYFIDERTGAPAAPMIHDGWMSAVNPTTAPEDAELVPPPETTWTLGLLERPEFELPGALNQREFVVSVVQRLALEVEGWAKVAEHLLEALRAERRAAEVRQRFAADEPSGG